MYRSHFFNINEKHQSNVCLRNEKKTRIAKAETASTLLDLYWANKRPQTRTYLEELAVTSFVDLQDMVGSHLDEENTIPQEFASSRKSPSIKMEASKTMESSASHSDNSAQVTITINNYCSVFFLE